MPLWPGDIASFKQDMFAVAVSLGGSSAAKTLVGAVTFLKWMHNGWSGYISLSPRCSVELRLDC